MTARSHGHGVRFWERNGSGRPLSAALRRGLLDWPEVVDLGKRPRAAGMQRDVPCSHRGGQGFKSLSSTRNCRSEVRSSLTSTEVKID